MYHIAEAIFSADQCQLAHMCLTSVLLLMTSKPDIYVEYMIIEGYVTINEYVQKLCIVHRVEFMPTNLMGEIIKECLKENTI